MCLKVLFKAVAPLLFGMVSRDVHKVGKCGILMVHVGLTNIYELSCLWFVM